MTNNIPSYLLSDCCTDICRNGTCGQMVKRNEETGRWFITMGHCGFNNLTNNRDGYSSAVSARRASVNILTGR